MSSPPAPAAGLARAIVRAWHSTETWAITTFGPPLLRWWGNPLLHETRAARPLPWRTLARIVPIGAGILALGAIAAWALSERALGAAMIALPLGAALIALAAAPLAGALAALKRLEEGRSPRGIMTAIPIEIVWGMALVGLWRLRWLIVALLIALPALIIGVLRLDVTAFMNYRQTALALGSAAPPEQTRLLTPGAGIPSFRLLMRAVSAGLLPLAAMPLLASLGVSAGILLRDAALSMTAALAGGLVALIVVGGAWQFATTIHWLGQGLEAIRLILIAAVLIGAGGLAWLVNRLNADWLVNIPPDEGII